MRSVLIILLSVGAQFAVAQSTFDDGALVLPADSAPRTKQPAPPLAQPKQPPAATPRPPVVNSNFPQCGRGRPTGDPEIAIKMFEQVLNMNDPLRKNLILRKPGERGSFQIFIAGDGSLYAHVVTQNEGTHDLPAFVCQRGNTIEASINAGWGGWRKAVVTPVSSTRVHIAGDTLDGNFDAVQAPPYTAR